MPLKIIHPQQSEVMGVGLVLISSPPGESPKRELYTGQIAEEAALLSRSWAVIAREIKPDQEGDKVRQVASDFDKSVQAFVGEHGIKCIIVIVGTSQPGIVIKGHSDDSTSEGIMDIIRSGLEPHFITNSSNEQTGNGLAKAANRDVDDASNQVPSLVRLELGPDERGYMKDQFVNDIADIVGLINTRLGFSESKESSGSVLD